jgi:hypothetical protein
MLNHVVYIVTTARHVHVRVSKWGLLLGEGGVGLSVLIAQDKKEDRKLPKCCPKKGKYLI